MAYGQLDPASPIEHAPPLERSLRSWRDFPYWLVVILAYIAWMAYLIATQDQYERAYDFIIEGLAVTLRVTAISFVLAVVIGLLAGLGRIARNVLGRNLAITYIEFVRGVPIIVLMITIGFVIVPNLATSIGFDNNSISLEWRAIIALVVIYGAFLAEVFRAGVESVPSGQAEAGRSLGMSHAQTMRRIILPQAIRNMLPALGNDLIAMLKDSSLVLILGVNDITHRARLYTGTSFDYDSAFFVLTFLYLTLTLTLSLLLAWLRRRMGTAA